MPPSAGRLVPIVTSLVVLAHGDLCAEGMRFDLAEFSTPPGFVTQSSGENLVLSRIDQARGELIVLAFFPSHPARGFAEEWEETAAKVIAVPKVAATRPGRTTAGHSFTEGGAAGTLNGTPVYGHLVTFHVGGRVQSVLVITPSLAAFERDGATLAAFVESVRFTAPAPAPAARANDRPLWKGAPIVGVWMGFKSTASFEYSLVKNASELQLAKHALRWRTFLADGSSFEGLPDRGLLGIDVAAARRDPASGAFWGTWTISGDKVTARQPSGRVQEYVVSGDVLREDERSTGRTQYWRARSVDGLKLDGTWSSFLQWDETQAGPTWRTRPLIRFTADGRFEDRGAFVPSPVDDPPPGAEHAPGRGSYLIAGFTLVLRYDDGRVVQRPFSAAPGAAPRGDSGVIFIGKFSFHRQ